MYIFRTMYNALKYNEISVGPIGQTIVCPMITVNKTRCTPELSDHNWQDLLNSFKEYFEIILEY